MNKKTKIKSTNGIRNLKIKKKNGVIIEVILNFGPHYSLHVKGGDDPTLSLAVTHHGVKLSAGELNGELEKAIEILRKKFVGGNFD